MCTVYSIHLLHPLCSQFFFNSTLTALQVFKARIQTTYTIQWKKILASKSTWMLHTDNLDIYTFTWSNASTLEMYLYVYGCTRVRRSKQTNFFLLAFLSWRHIYSRNRMKRNHGCQRIWNSIFHSLNRNVKITLHDALIGHTPRSTYILTAYTEHFLAMHIIIIYTVTKFEMPM